MSGHHKQDATRLTCQPLMQQPCLIPKAPGKCVLRHDTEPDLIPNENTQRFAWAQRCEQPLRRLADILLFENKIGQPQGQAVDQHRPVMSQSWGKIERLLNRFPPWITLRSVQIDPGAHFLIPGAAGSDITPRPRLGRHQFFGMAALARSHATQHQNGVHRPLPLAEPCLSQQKGAMSPFPSLSALHSACLALPAPDDAALAAIRAREAVLTKPAGSLGQLEEIVAWYGAWRPLVLTQVDICIFAGNHGVLAQNVSSWPASVTAAMVENFEQGGAAINHLAQVAGAGLHVVPVGALAPSADLTEAPALTVAQFLEAVSTGYDAVPQGCSLLALGEMGVGNTTAAAAMAAAFFGEDGRYWAGRGAGLDGQGVARKARAIDKALALHGRNHAPLDLARLYGGWELAALMGATLAARHRRIPVLLDGFVVTAAVAPLAAVTVTGLAHTRLAHRSHEQGHHQLASRLGLNPLLDLQLRLGEGSGAALAVPLVRAALACHNGMASFADVAIDDKNERINNS